MSVQKDKTQNACTYTLPRTTHNYDQAERSILVWRSPHTRTQHPTSAVNRSLLQPRQLIRKIIELKKRNKKTQSTTVARSLLDFFEALFLFPSGVNRQGRQLCHRQEWSDPFGTRTAKCPDHPLATPVRRAITPPSLPSSFAR